MDKIGNPELTFSSLALHVISLHVLLNYLGNMKITVQKMLPRVYNYNSLLAFNSTDNKTWEKCLRDLNIFAVLAVLS